MAQLAQPFRIYDASAGSGKTFTLAREYLVLLLAPGASQAFRQMLAITFTNKAVAELKQRILQNLKSFAGVAADTDRSDLFISVQSVLGADRETLRKRAGLVLQEILHNYAFFDISTIDRFNHRILRTFSQDLRLPANFEVALDTDVLLQQAVEALIEKTGTDPELTESLIAFALEKSAEDRHWDIAGDLQETGKLLFNETHFTYLDALKGKGIADYRELRQHLDREKKQCEAQLTTTAGALLNTLSTNNLEDSHFNRGSFPKFLKGIAAGDFSQNTGLKWQTQFAEGPLYPKHTPEAVKALLDRLQPELAAGLNSLLELLVHRAYLANAASNMAPFTVLGLLQAELNAIQESQRLLPVARFNAIIAAEIAGQPAPYIYERLGEKFRHYFIDEFQDTSELQWKNLIPLIGNALESVDEQGRQGSLILVGDAKQAIYRWRGGNAEQFLNLVHGPGNPFSIPAQTVSLPVNYRSRQTLIDFNNAFFSQHSRALNHPGYQELFENGSAQKAHSKDPGWVHIEFLDPESSDTTAGYAHRTLELVREILEAGYSLGDICVLTRKSKEGVAVSEVLLAEGIPIISSETLLLKNHPGVVFLMDLLRHLQNPEDLNYQFEVLQYLFGEQPEAHAHIRQGLGQLSAVLNTYGFSVEEARHKPVYDILEAALAPFSLAGRGDAYFIHLLDLAQELSATKDSSVATFLEHWDAKADQWSIAAPEDRQAVRLMTVHKAKGLEFPVVIYPFADTSVYLERRPRIWVEVDPASHKGFRCLQLSKRKEMEGYSPMAAEAYLKEQQKLELDAFNVLYVAQTRAVEALYILTREKSTRSDATLSDYGALYRSYLQTAGHWEESKRTYTFGTLMPLGKSSSRNTREEALPLQYSQGDRKALQIVTRAGRLWDTDRGNALEYGNLIHIGLALVEQQADTALAARQLSEEGYISREEEADILPILQAVTSHPQVSPYFQPGLTVYCEREIIGENGLFLRPDRLVIGADFTAVIDYKTGQAEPGHRTQLQAYMNAATQMGLGPVRGMLVYISDSGIQTDLY